MKKKHHFVSPTLTIPSIALGTKGHVYFVKIFNEYVPVPFIQLIDN